MNSKAFNITGWILMAIGALIPLGTILNGIYKLIIHADIGIRFSDIFMENIVSAIAIFVLAFLPGLAFYRIAKKARSNKLENWALGLTITTFALEIILFLISAVPNLGSRDLMTAIAWGMFLFGGFLLIPHGIGILLLVINWFGKKA